MKDELDSQIERLESNLADYKKFQAEKHLKDNGHVDEIAELLDRANLELEKALF